MAELQSFTAIVDKESPNIHDNIIEEHSEFRKVRLIVTETIYPIKILTVDNYVFKTKSRETIVLTFPRFSIGGKKRRAL